MGTSNKTTKEAKVNLPSQSNFQKSTTALGYKSQYIYIGPNTGSTHYKNKVVFINWDTAWRENVHRLQLVDVKTTPQLFAKINNSTTHCTCIQTRSQLLPTASHSSDVHPPINNHSVSQIYTLTHKYIHNRHKLALDQPT